MLIFAETYGAEAGKVTFNELVRVLEKNANGKMSMSRITLRPAIVFGGATPSAADLDGLHHAAHDECFIANSLKTEIVVEPVVQ